MQYLKCQAQDCTYNAESKCNARAIRVGVTGQQTFCDTYARADAFSAVEIFDMNAADTEFGAMGAPRIACSVTQCAYNQSFRCRAHGVHIGPPHDALVCNCRTYRPK